MLYINYTILSLALSISLTVFYPLYKNYITSSLLILAHTLVLTIMLIATLVCIHGIFIVGDTLNLVTNNLLSPNSTLPCALSLSVDQISIAFVALVEIISICANLYTLGYFKGEGRELQFVFWLNAFTNSMILVIFAGNFFTLFLGWELIGITSFFLINFWFRRRGTLKSSMKALCFNTISDFSLLFAITILYNTTGSDDIQTVIYILQYQNPSNENLTQAAAGLILCSGIKSVQLIGHLWLPDSMDAPVPASSLIHSATLVSAGLYLILKFYPLFVLTNLHNTMILWGSLTSLYGGLSAASQTDLKKILAYSTMSHCGFMWVLACLGQILPCLTYLILHGLFKAGTFFIAGVFIQNSGSQDIRWFRNYHNTPALTLALFFMGANLAALPLTIGYLYKQSALYIITTQISNPIALTILMLSFLASPFYLIKLNTFWLTGFNRSVKIDYASTPTNHKKTQVFFGYSQLNVFISLVIIVVSGLLFIIFKDTLFIDLNLSVESENFNNHVNEKLLESLVKICDICYHWFFLLSLTVIFILQTQKKEYVKRHKFLLSLILILGLVFIMDFFFLAAKTIFI